MEDIKNTETVKTGTDGTVDKTDAKNELKYSQSDLDKRIQSENDKIRTEYSKKIKELEAKVKELTPVEKSEKEIEFEKRLADVEARENALKLRDALSAKGINSDLCAYLKSDTDVDALAVALEKYANDRVRVSGFKPTGHKTGESMSKEEFRKMTYVQKEQLFRENPDLYRHLTGR